MKVDIDQILQQATAEFATLGFDAMSMRTLAKKCGLSAPALYYHFESKEELYNEVYNSLLDGLINTIDNAMQTQQSTEERMSTFIETLFDLWIESPLLILTQRDVISAHVAPGKSLSKNYYSRLMTHIEKIFADDFKTPLNPGTTYAFAALLFGYISLIPFSHSSQEQTSQDVINQRKKELLTMCQSLMNMRLQY